MRYSLPSSFRCKAQLSSSPPEPQVGSYTLHLVAVHDQCHEFYHRTVGIELCGSMAAVIGKFFDQVLIGIAQFIVGHIAQAELVLGVMLWVGQGFIT